MPIPFNPPDWLIRDYMNQKNEGQQVLDSGLQAAQTYLAYKKQKAASQSDLLGTYVKAYDAGGRPLLEDVAKRMGLTPPAWPARTAIQAGPGGTAGVMSDQQPAMQPAVNPTTVPQGQSYMPTPEEEAAQQSLPPQPSPQASMMPKMGSPIISHWNSTMGSQQQAPAAPAQGAPVMPARPPAGSVPGFENPEELLENGSHGIKQLMAGEALGKYRQAMEANQPVTVEQYRALQGGDENELRAAFPNGLPRGLAGSALAAQSRNVRVTTDPYGNPIRVPVAGGPATPIEIPGSNLNPLQKKLNPNEYKAFQAEVNDFDKDKTVADNRVALNNMANVESMLKNYNPSLTGPIASRQARAIAGEVGALTDSDIARQTLDPSLLGRLKKMVTVAATGKLPEDQLNLLKESIAAIKENARSRVYSVAQERATRLSNQFGGKASVEELMGSMNLPSNFSSQTVSRQPGTGSVAPKSKLTPQEQAELAELEKRFGGKP